MDPEQSVNGHGESQSFSRTDPLLLAQSSFFTTPMSREGLHQKQARRGHRSAMQSEHIKLLQVSSIAVADVDCTDSCAVFLTLSKRPWCVYA